MTRKDIILSPSYWIADIQLALFRCADKFMKKNSMNRTELAQHLNVSKGYVTQLLSGDYNFTLSKLVETSMAIGYVPQVTFVLVEEVCKMDIMKSNMQIVSTEVSFSGVYNNEYQEAA